MPRLSRRDFGQVLVLQALLQIGLAALALRLPGQLPEIVAIGILLHLPLVLAAVCRLRDAGHTAWALLLVLSPPYGSWKLATMLTETETVRDWPA